MGIDITIGEQTPAPVALLFRCFPGKCPKDGSTCPTDCRTPVREEERPDSPRHIVMANDGKPHAGGYNFDRMSYGYYARVLDETGIAEAWPVLNFAIQPSIVRIPPGLGAALHKLAQDIEMGLVKTAYPDGPQGDAAFFCWMAWWCTNAPVFYGDRAVILFG